MKVGRDANRLDPRVGHFVPEATKGLEHFDRQALELLCFGRPFAPKAKKRRMFAEEARESVVISIGENEFKDFNRIAPLLGNTTEDAFLDLPRRDRYLELT